MSEKSNTYGIYFDRFELEVDRNGQLLNPENLRIIEFVFDEEISDEPIDIRRIDKNGNVIEEYPDLSDLDYVGYDDEPTIADAMNQFYEWLENNVVWVETSRQTYWQPAEYACVGIEGCM